ncbi:Receptor-like protein kinase 7 [Camellia lanceoleosa]|uniref:Receptor-like protein kinase 7 n=1 Tax=Camellia lanceoleosa TaxID=1840588 RepID=A0ACC0GL97_9ERIC|nr:Receptor-like protein kinase 7 [Camellia lanceoleosa]
MVQSLCIGCSSISTRVASRWGLADNELSGELPDELGHLTNLVSLSLANNNFRGNLSQPFHQLKNMIYL